MTNIQFTKNFSLSEMVESSTAHRKGYTEQFNPPASVIACLDKLCKHVLQPLRDYINHPIEISSGYRCKRLNTSIGGAKTSDHMDGQAADLKLTINGKNCNHLIWEAIGELKLNFKQAIWEFGDSKNPDWVHISFDQTNNKKEKLKASKVNGKTVYTRI